MALLELIDTEGHRVATLPDEEARDSLDALGVSCGSWPLRDVPVSNLPQLTYARELLAMQRRFGSRRIQRFSARRGPLPSASNEGHDDGLCIVLEGRLEVSLPTPAGRASLSVGAGEWVALPKGVPRTVRPIPEPVVELLRLRAMTAGDEVRV